MLDHSPPVVVIVGAVTAGVAAIGDDMASEVDATDPAARAFFALGGMVDEELLPLGLLAGAGAAAAKEEEAGAGAASSLRRRFAPEDVETSSI